MAQPVWVLSVDLQTKTATFQSGMAEAAKSARGAFTDIKAGSGDMGEHVSSNMFASRHAIMAVSEAFGVQVPRAITALLSHIAPLGAALEAAFPFAAIALGAVLVIEELVKLQAEGVKLTEDQIKFGTAVQMAFNSMDQKLVQAQIRTDEFRNDHVGKLKHELELINMQSMAELAQQFGILAKAADAALSGIKDHWYTIGIGATGAKNALDQFQTQYESLVTQGKTGQATDLLAGTLKSAKAVLAAQQEMQSGGLKSQSGTGSDEAWAANLKYGAEMNTLKAAGVGHTDKEVMAQTVLVDALQKQVVMEGKISDLKKADSGNATASTGKDLSALAAEGARQAAEHKQKMGEIALSMEREQAESSMAIAQATIQQRLAVDTRLAESETAIQLQGNEQLQAALDKGGKDYNNQLKSLKDKATEITAQGAATVAGLTAKATEQQYRLDVQNLTQSEREKIDATEQGSTERLAAIDAAIREEQSKQLQNTQFYRELQQQRVEFERQASAEAAKLAAESGKIDADNTEKLGELSLAAGREQQSLADSARRVSTQQRIEEELKASKDEYDIKFAAMKQDEAALDKTGKDYQNKLKEQQDREQQLTQQHANEMAAISNKSDIERNQRSLAAARQYQDALAGGLTQVIMGHKSFASEMNSLGDQVASGMLQNAIKSILTNDMTKESDAAAAARKAYLTGEEIGGPAGFILGPIMGAAAFAGVMAFADGGVVPGVGRGDTVPAMLTPGEGVIPGGVMDGLSNMARSGNMGGGGTHYHVHVKPSFNLQSLDTGGMEKMLNKHSEVLAKHVNNEIRKQNR